MEALEREPAPEWRLARDWASRQARDPTPLVSRRPDPEPRPPLALGTPQVPPLAASSSRPAVRSISLCRASMPASAAWRVLPNALRVPQLSRVRLWPALRRQAQMPSSWTLAARWCRTLAQPSALELVPAPQERRPSASKTWQPAARMTSDCPAAPSPAFSRVERGSALPESSQMTMRAREL
jgi:hypothetical protein